MELKNQEGARRVGPAADLDSEGDGSMQDYGGPILVNGVDSRPLNPNPIMKNGKKPRSGEEDSQSLSPLAVDLVAVIRAYVGAVEQTILVDQAVENGQTLVVLRIRGFRGVGEDVFGQPTPHSTQVE